MNSESYSRTVVVVGGGFGGLNAVSILARDKKTKIVLIDRRNHHLFQPLLYQVATAGLAPSDIASPIRGIFSHSPNVEVLLAEVSDVDLKAKAVVLKNSDRISYDSLILACGAERNYFGHNDWESFAPSLKSLEDAIEIRKRILLSYEKAETSLSESDRKSFLTYVIVGGGPTGVELAGAISEIAHSTLRSDFRKINSEATEIYLVEAGPRILSTFSPELSLRAKKDLERMNVKVLENCKVLQIGENLVKTTEREFYTRNIIWTAGVRGSDLSRRLNLPLDPQGRLMVNEDLSLPGYPEVFAIGDMAHFTDPHQGVLPGLAAVAVQQGRFVAERLISRKPKAFIYKDKGSMATIGRKKAIVQIGERLKLSGAVAWLVWLAVHLILLIGFRNKAIVLFQWAWSYITFNKGSRLIVGRDIESRSQELLKVPQASGEGFKRT